jgi:hypothetical protein
LSQNTFPRHGDPVTQVDATQGDETVILTHGFTVGRTWTVERIDGSENTVTITAESGDLLNGMANGSLTLPAWEAVTVDRIDGGWRTRGYSDALTTDELDDRYVGTRAILAQGTKLYSRLATPNTAQALRWVGLGDSIASLKMRWLYEPLNKAWGAGVAGVAISAGSSGTGWGITGVTNNSATGTITDATTDFDAWFSGVTTRFATNSSRTYGIGGVSAYWDIAKVYYVTGPSSPDGGTFKIQVDGVDDSTYSDVSTSNPTVSMGIATITKGSVAQRSLAVVNLTGAHRIIGVAFFNSSQGGLIYSGIAQGGIALPSAIGQATARANLATFLTDFAPDVISFEMKENSNYGGGDTYAARLDTLFDLIAAATPTTTVIGIGSTPLASGDADQVAQNATLKAACADHGFIYWDGYAPVKDYATLNALGWAGDGIHVDDKASAFLAGLMARDLGLFEHTGLAARSSNIDVNNARFHTAFNIGDIRQDGAVISNGQLSPTGSGFDVDLKLRRSLYVYDQAGATSDTTAWKMGSAGGDQQVPDGARIGASGPYLRAPAATYLASMSARSSGSLRDLNARAFMPGVTTLNNQSGAVSCDLTTGTVFVVNLTGNVTSFTFTNTGGTAIAGVANIVVHFVQDATGSRTLAGPVAAIKWASSAPTLTTTASRRDIFYFQLISAVYYEVSRSMNVG